MQTKSKEQLRVYRLCGLLILMACCFRSFAVLREPMKEGTGEIFQRIPYIEKEKQPSTAPPTVCPTVPVDSSLVDIDNRCGAVFGEQELFQMPLSFRITEEPCILIVHSHGSEAYREKEGYRSSDPEENVVRVGREVAELLNAAGISTLHDTTLHDETRGYDSAYQESAKAIADYLEEYPNIQMVIDIHRDAVEDAAGRQKAMTTLIEGQPVAKLLLVMGTDLSGQTHPNWQRNLSFAMKLQSVLRQEHKELLRQTSLRASRYNQHLSPFSILLEVGSAGNSGEEALRAARYFAEALTDLLFGLDASEP